MSILIRIATPADAAACLDIYQPYITGSAITFETEVPSVETFAGRIESYLQQYPWLIAEEDGIVMGYAYGYRYRERIAYQWSLECSVYIHPDYHRRGVGQALYSILFDILKQQGFCNVYAVITLPNEKSVQLHERSGFSWFATYENVGNKNGKWENVGWWKLQLNEYIDNPADPIPFSNFDKTSLPGLFEEKAKLIK